MGNRIVALAGDYPAPHRGIFYHEPHTFQLQYKKYGLVDIDRAYII